MRFAAVGGKAGHILDNVRSHETNTIGRGRPLVLDLNGTDDGLSVVLPSTAGATKSASFLYGVATADIEYNGLSETLLYGICPFALVTINSRSATSASWASLDSVPPYQLLGLDIDNNAFNIASANTGAGNAYFLFATLLDSIKSQAGSATASSDTRLVILQGFRTFVKML